MIDGLTRAELEASLRIAEQDPALAEELRIATVRALRLLASYCANPKSPHHAMAVEYMTPRKLHFARWLAANGFSTLK